MHDERTAAQREGTGSSDLSPATLEVMAQEAVLGLLLQSDGPGIWSEDELARAIGKPMDVEDAIVRLHGEGLIHRLNGFVFAARAAIHYEKINR
jgi:hypothetical protein